MSQKIKIINADGTETEVEVAKVITTDAELDTLLKSENSKGKGEILKTLGVTSVDEAKTKMGAQTEVEGLTKTVNNLTNELENERHLRIANELGIKPELVNDAITLAKANMGEGKDFKTVLKIKADAIGAIKTDKSGKQEVPSVIGAQKTQEQLDLEAKEAAEMKRLRDL